MSEFLLILYSRKGCCLCEGLEQRLSSLSLQHLTPPLSLHVIDIDASETPKELRARYDLQVPVMTICRNDLKALFELPRVSPRLNSEGLLKWLQNTLTKNL